MTFLILSIITNASIYLIFKWFDKLGIHVFEAIVANYITAFSLGLIVVPDLHQAIDAASVLPEWTLGGLGLGVVFISIFYLMAVTAQKVGVSVTTIASKMSLAIAVLLFVLIDPNEQINAMKIIAIILALAGVVLSSLKDGAGGFQIKNLLFPLIILLGSTIIDFGIAYFSEMPQTDSELALYSCLSFGTAAIVGLIIVLKHFLTRDYKIRPRDFIAGVGLGVVNYGSIFFLVKSYDSGILPKSSLLPVNNLAVVLIGAAGAVVFFKEKLSAKNKLGIALAAVAIALIAFAD